MSGIVIWAQSNCRSMMALYRAVAGVAGVPVLITLWRYNNDGCESDVRTKVGFRVDEFSDVLAVPVGENYAAGSRILQEHKGWTHLFCVWQPSPVYRKLIVNAKQLGSHVGVMCESPCNMSSGWQGVLKSAFIRLCLPIMAFRVVRSADFFINYSGNDATPARRIGWSRRKIIAFGYYPPPIEGSKRCRRKVGSQFFILSTGILSRHRGADVLVKALRILKDRGMPYRAVITQEGELLSSLKDFAQRFDLPIEFPGFLPMREIIKLYETCSVYVGAGRSEPWGMRLNDALNCGAPLVVSTGMGGVNLVRELGCGLEYENGNANDLADKLCSMMLDNRLYNRVCEMAFKAGDLISPQVKAKDLLRKIAKVYE